ncbi:hypothetical protein CSX00_00595 [Pseudobutyrivibrio ruminis]|uniref:DUF4367 domain-containing protein n=1 Tax=Pseudobutyrivibrio ruminis TaxID=46206 RepID=A0A2G3EDY3_9FIRM|nr:hypothetical protein [Pseudobutyrivibrio ruminis]PHU41397.1 hypothetical protein CSX00_00595 [Pseudobutyrivibrio ruminis]
MKKRMAFVLSLLILSLSVLGCGAKETAAPATDTPDGDVNGSAVEDVAEEPVENASVSLPLPAYKYTGDEEYLAEISDYLIDYFGKEAGLDDLDVLIPYSIIVQTDENSEDDIVVYGSFNIDGYILRNTTLCSGPGARSYGIFHISKADGNVTITDGQLSQTYYDMQDMFSPIDGMLDKINALSDEDIEKARVQSIEEYVTSNNLGITQWQDFGRAPEAIAGATTSDEDEMYTFKSNFDYEITYDLRKITLSSIGEEGDMFGRVESGDFYSGTFMVICTSAYSDPEKAVYENNTDISPKDLEFTDTTIGSYPAKRAEWTEKTDDGSEMRYVFYGIDVKETVITVKLSTTHSEHVPEMSIEELDEFFEDTLATFKYN